MKKRCVKFLNNAMYLMLFCMSLMLSGCGFNTTSYSNIDAVNTVVDLSNADYEIIETVTGESKQTYVFGIGGLSKKSLTENAKADMYKNANLTANEAIIYPSVTTSVASYLGIVTNIRAVASGYKIRFKRDIAKSETTDILANKKEDLSTKTVAELKEKSVDVQIPLSKEDEELMISMMEYVYNSCDPEYNEKYDIMHVGALEEKEGKVYIHNITMEENKMIKETTLKKIVYKKKKIENPALSKKKINDFFRVVFNFL